MAYIEGEQRNQHTLFPTTLDELIRQDHVCRVIEAFVGRLDMAKLGFVRSEPAETGQIIENLEPRSPLQLCLLPPVFLDYYLNDAGGYDVPRHP